MKRRSLRSLLLTAALASISACAPFAVQAPSGFVKLKDSVHPFKAVSAEGAVLAVRHWDNEQEADLQFWAKVVNDELTSQRGYKLKGSRPLRAGEARGRWHHYLGEHKGERHYYVLALFITSGRIFAVEATAPEKDYPKHEKAIGRFVSSFKPQ